MKRLLAVIMLIALLSAPIFVQAGYSLFVFAGTAAAEIKQKTISATNTMFGEVSNDYYQVYFFASPYYATGAEVDGKTITDPLEIANLGEKNPYDCDEELCIIAEGKGAVAANIRLNNSDRYAACKINKDSNGNLLDGKGDRNLSLEFFQKKDFTGYIREQTVTVNGKEITIEKTSTYVSFTVQGNIDADLLNAIVAQSEFRDTWSYGPEFIGWTADKQKTLERTVYNYGTDTNGKVTFDRYVQKNGQYTFSALKGDPESGYYIEKDVNGNEIKIDCIGNFGCQGGIDQVTSNTSLSALDASDADGSKAGDKVIYLYPVFESKNYAKEKTDLGYRTPIVKFRIDPGNAPQTYFTHEVDYDNGRYTVCLFQRKYSDTNQPNYYTGDFYYDANKGIQLDIGDWDGNWYNLLTQAKLKSLNLSTGYYNIDLTIWQLSGTDMDDGVEAKKQMYVDSQKYVVVESGNVSGYYFVIGFQKVDDFHMVYENNSYGSSDDEQVYTVTKDLNRYYYVDEIYLDKYKKFQFMIESGSVKMTAMGSSDLNFNGKEYKAGYSTADPMSLSGNGDIMTCNVAGYYSFLFTVTYQDGKPTEIQVAYLKHEDKYQIVILSKEPENNIFIDQKVDEKAPLYAPTWDEGDIKIGSAFAYGSGTDTYIVASYSADRHSTVDSSKSFEVYVGTEVKIKSVGDFLSERTLYDTATGVEVTELLKNGDFQLNRNYVLYIG